MFSLPLTTCTSPAFRTFTARRTPPKRDTSAASSVSPACLSRTLLDYTGTGVLSTTSKSGAPLGTAIAYIQDTETGTPLLRLRADAVHTTNIREKPQASLFIQAPTYPAKLLARVTLLGTVDIIEGSEARELVEQYRNEHGAGVGVDAVQDSDLFGKLNIDECFYVGGMGSTSQAELFSGTELLNSEPDGLYQFAENLVEELNSTRTEDIARLVAKQCQKSFLEVDSCKVLWVDSCGMYVQVSFINGATNSIVRYEFEQELPNVMTVKSAISMASQAAWEAQRDFQQTS